MEKSTLCAALAGGAHIIEAAAVLLLSTTFAPCILYCAKRRRGAHRSAHRVANQTERHTVPLVLSSDGGGGQ